MDPGSAAVAWYRRRGDTMEFASGSRVLGLSGDDVAAVVDWPSS